MIAIIDYGAGNTRSVINALARLDADYVLTKEAEEILAADHVILPGVGHAVPAMHELSQSHLIPVIKEIRKPFLGICLGMQLLYESSMEGPTECLGIIPGNICRFEDTNMLVPQMGWHDIVHSDDTLFEGVQDSDMVYAVHSYRAEVCMYTIATGHYGRDYAAAVRRDNYYGVQFHPEKSAKTGSRILKNFITL